MQTNFDIIFVTETHLIKGSRFCLPGFISFHNSRSTSDDKKPHGGVSCFLKKSIYHNVRKITKNISEMIIVELIDGHKLFSNYIAPIDSPYSDISAFSKVANMFIPKDSAHVVIGGGDLNARVGDISQKLPLNCIYRENVDSNVNEHGKILRNICNSYNC